MPGKLEQLVRRRLGRKCFVLGLDVEGDMLVRIGRNRYALFWTEEETMEAAALCLEKHRCLLESDLEANRIRIRFMDAMAEAITAGSGTYAMLVGAWRRKFGFWGVREGILAPLERMLNQKYPNIPGARQHFRWEWWTDHRRSSAVLHPFAKQLIGAFSRPARVQLKRRKISGERFAQEFLEKHRWCLERLSRCSSIFVNKYKEEICRQVAYDLGLDTDRDYFRWLPYLRKPTAVDGNDAFLKRIRDLMVDSLTEEELALFEETDCGGRHWSFGDQILDRYRNKCPSFVPLEEIEKRVGQIMGDYRPLLNSETAEVVRELILDEAEGAAFVDRASHLWNLEMEKNLGKGNVNGMDPKAKGTIELLMKGIPEELWNGPDSELREKLRARWSRAQVAVGGAEVKAHLRRLPELGLLWRSSTPEVDLQVFLAAVDPLFLYPGRGRTLKRMAGALDTGRAVHLKDPGNRVRDHLLWYIEKWLNRVIGVVLSAIFGAWLVWKLIHGA